LLLKPSSYQDSIDINQAIEVHLPLVKRIAHQICSRLPPNVEVDDLIQEGLTGLLDALTRYKPQANLAFEVYAKTRIRGAIYDSCRKNDILPRNQRDELENLEKVTRRLEQDLGRHPSEKEIAGGAKMSLEDYHAIVATMVHLMPLDDLSDDLLPSDSENSDPMRSLALSQLSDRIAKILETLPENEQLVFSLHYQEDLSYREIAQVMNISPGRISQIHTQGMIRIRSKLKI
jgi:RNA polymerase sigma factor for flagellar operon FliA